MKEEMKKVIDTLYQGVFEDTKKEHSEDIQRILDFIESNEKLNIKKNPENFNLFVCYETEKVVRAAISEMLPADDENNRLAFLYHHYDYLDNHISSYIAEYAGRACCVDRSRYILKSYQHYLETGEKFDMNREGYYICPFGSCEQWIEFIRVLSNTFYRWPTEKERNFLKQMNASAETYFNQQVEIEKEFQRKLNVTEIDFVALADLQIPVQIENYNEGRLLACLFDKYKDSMLTKDDITSAKNVNIKNWICNGCFYPAVAVIQGGRLDFFKLDGWTGNKPVSLAQISKERKD